MEDKEEGPRFYSYTGAAGISRGKKTAARLHVHCILMFLQYHCKKLRDKCSNISDLLSSTKFIAFMEIPGSFFQDCRETI